MIVTIDGPAGSGKSTTAKALADRLGFRFLDTGAMYRAVAHACVSENIATSDDERVAEVARQLTIQLKENRVVVNGNDVTDQLRTADVTLAASKVAVNPAVRDAMTVHQREFAADSDVVTEGRDQGTVVFPDAECKFFLTADPRKRAERRQKELAEEGKPVTIDEVEAQIRERDRRDETRSVGPLEPAEDAIQIDTSSLGPAEVLDQLERIVREH